ncbi:MAG: STAS domain-containing protein [Solirubrobacteraceae bacterium]
MITFPDRAEAGTVLSLRSRNERALVAGHHWIAVDLRAAYHIDTQTLGKLCVALRQIGRHGAKLAVVGADRRVHRVLELCAIDGLELHQTVDSVFAQTSVGERERRRRSWRSRFGRQRPALRGSASGP